jgi:hypothetical protein
VLEAIVEMLSLLEAQTNLCIELSKVTVDIG